jgi:3-hydroxybutyryl-CoA dehydrogenase
MGQQIVLQAAVCGFEASCVEINPEALKKAQAFAEKWLQGRIDKNAMTPEAAQQVKDRLLYTTQLEEAAVKADLVIEAAVEDLGVKRSLFAQLDKFCPEHTILSTNSSYIVSSKIADATKRPDKVLNLHFFNPALVMKLAEVVKGPHTSDETVEEVLAVSRALNKVPTLVEKEIYGFVCNRIFSAITHEALYMLDQEVASIEDIDNAIRNGLGHPMGPLQLLDMTGIDLEYKVSMDRYRETGDPADKPSRRLPKDLLWGIMGANPVKVFTSIKGTKKTWG